MSSSNNQDTQDANYWNNMQDMQRGGGPSKQYVQEKASYALDMLRANGTKEEMTALANNYATSVGMNQPNRDLLITLKTEGKEAFIKKAFEDPRDSNRVMSYSEMRAMYG